MAPGRASPGAAGAKKKFVRLASVFPSPPFRSSDFAGPRRSRLYGFDSKGSECQCGTRLCGIVDQDAGVSIPNSSPFSRSTRLPFTSTPSPPAPLVQRNQNVFMILPPFYLAVDGGAPSPAG